ncbi:MAG: LrgB family protein [Candidatus Limivivens sp.]|nr:LrgB family protein [Candidatus Limivivens sp.]
MNEFLTESLFFGMAVSLIGYGMGLKLKKRFRYGFLNPLLISIVFVIVVLKVLKIDYETYNASAKYLSYLLTPATVCLAIPLYQQISLLKDNLLAVALGILSGVLASLGGVLVLALAFGLTHEQYVTLLPKSITTAIGLGVSEELGGITTITVAVIIVTGVLGNVIGETVCRIFKISEPIAVGLSFGTSAHAIGTTKALELGEVQGAMSSLSIAVAGLLTVVLASVFTNFL